MVDKTIPLGKWWSVAKSICQIKNRTTTSSPINANNNIMTHHFDKSNALNEYFTSISTLHNEPEFPDLPKLSHCELSDIVITKQDALDQFQILEINKPPGPDKLAP